MGRRHSSRMYNPAPQAAPPPPPATAPAAPQTASPLNSLLSMLGPSKTPATAAQPMASQLSSLLSILGPSKASSPIPFSLPALPTAELMGGVSNLTRGLVANGNWWILLLIIFLFFPKVSNRMFGGILKE